MSIDKKHHIEKGTRQPLHSIMYIFLLIISGLMMFWLAPSLANQKSDSLLLAAIALFTFGLVFASLSVIQLSIHIKAIAQQISNIDKDN